jgi:hypothetical protein
LNFGGVSDALSFGGFLRCSSCAFAPSLTNLGLLSHLHQLSSLKGRAMALLFQLYALFSLAQLYSTRVERCLRASFSLLSNSLAPIKEQEQEKGGAIVAIVGGT